MNESGHHRRRCVPSQRRSKASGATDDYAGRLTDIANYVSRMLQSPVKRRHLLILCREKQRFESLSFIYGRGGIQALIFVKSTHPVREQAIRRIFTTAAVAPRQDELLGEPGDRSR